jgi:hypothetical protein
MSLTWKVVSSKQSNNGNSGKNQITRAYYQICWVEDGTEGCFNFGLVLPDTDTSSGSFKEFEDVTADDVIAWGKSQLGVGDNPTLDKVTEVCKKEWAGVKAYKEEVESTNEKEW